MRLAATLLACALTLAAQNPPKFEVDPTWPKPLPAGWITGQLGGVCTDSHDHVVVVNRRDITDEEKETSQQAPPILMFDAAGRWSTPGAIRKCRRTPSTAAPSTAKTTSGSEPTATASSRNTATMESC